MRTGLKRRFVNFIVCFAKVWTFVKWFLVGWTNIDLVYQAELSNRNNEWLMKE
jgi:hypothetical protein